MQINKNHGLGTKLHYTHILLFNNKINVMCKLDYCTLCSDRGTNITWPQHYSSCAMALSPSIATVASVQNCFFFFVSRCYMLASKPFSTCTPEVISGANHGNYGGGTTIGCWHKLQTALPIVIKCVEHIKQRWRRQLARCCVWCVVRDLELHVYGWIWKLFKSVKG